MIKKWKMFLLLFVLIPTIVHAAGSGTISAPSSVELNGKVTVKVTLKNMAAWNIQILSSGSTSGCSQKFADATSNGANDTKVLEVTCKATSLGVISFTVVGDVTSADGKTTNISLSKKVNVVQPREKSDDATLSSLSVVGYDLNPVFEKNTLEYKIDVPSTVNSIKIDAKVSESHASLTGTGEFEVVEGLNTFKVDVTAETGKKISYTLIVNVEDKTPIYVSIDGKKYTIIKNSKSLVKPDLYEETTISIEDISIPAFKNELSSMTLIGAKDEDGNIVYILYNSDLTKCKVYNEVKSRSLSLYINDFPEPIQDYQKRTVVIHEREYIAYSYNETSSFVIIYATDLETGESNYYSYDIKNESFQIWNQEESTAFKEELKTYTFMVYILGAGLLFSFLLILCLLFSKKKKPKKDSNKKEKNDKEEKNYKQILANELEKEEK